MQPSLYQPQHEYVRASSLDKVLSQGWLYVAVNQLHKAPPFTGGKDQGKPPYSIYKVWVGGVEE